jgi:receptor protein-tyrosine kinase
VTTIEKALAKQKKQNDTLNSNVESSKIASAGVIIENHIATSSPFTLLGEKQNDVSTSLPSTSKMITLNGERLAERGFIYGINSTHHIQEQFRHIKRKLLNNAFGPAAKTLSQSNLVMVTSTNPNEGKTYISINLALSIALEQDKTVLLIDADVLRPSLHRELEFESSEGLLEYLLSEVDDLSDIIYSTNLNNLKIIPAGKPHYLTNELLASNRMELLAKELAERYPDRIVIFDCPPILGVTETPVLSNLVGQAIIVVEESKTKLDEVKKASSLLNEDIAVGFVMNKTINTKKDGYGYYGYGYGKNNL